MPKYISLDDLQTYPFRIDRYDKEHGNEHFIYGCESVIEYAENLPTIDIVRCRDCKYHRAYYRGESNFTHDCGWWLAEVNPNDYCSYGKR